jgi:hypothetical protein
MVEDIKRRYVVTSLVLKVEADTDKAFRVTLATGLGRIPATPAPALKRAAAENVEAPWSSKRSRTTGPDSILALGRSVDGIGKVIENVFAPKKSSAMSPTKKVAAARKLALEDADGGYIAASDRTRLNILFGRDTTAADAYISDEDPFLRAETAHELLNPTQNYQYP